MICKIKLSVQLLILCIILQIMPFSLNAQTAPNPVAVINQTPMGANPKLMEAEPVLPLTTDSTIAAPGTAPSDTHTDTGGSGVNAAVSTTGPDLTLLWNCRRNSTMNKEKCAGAMQLFCSGYCTRLNCAILSNRATCLDICNPSNHMMAPCVAAGKRNTLIQHVNPQNFAPPQAAGMMGGMNPQMMQQMMMMQMAGQAGGALGSGLEKGMDSLFGGGSKKKGSSVAAAASSAASSAASTTTSATTSAITAAPSIANTAIGALQSLFP